MGHGSEVLNGLYQRFFWPLCNSLFRGFKREKTLASRVYSRTYRGKEERISKKTEFNIFFQRCTKAGELTVLAGMFVFPFQTLGKFLSKYVLMHVH